MEKVLKGIKLKKAMLAAVLMFCISAPSAQFVSAAGKMPTELIPLGTVVGISVESEGVMIVSIGEVVTQNGKSTPASDAGLQAGDVIKTIGSDKVDSIEDLKKTVKSNGNNSVAVKVERNGRLMQFTVTPVLSTSGAFEMGLWLRDALAGMGTLTFVDPATGVVGVLGHAINDAETKTLFPFRSGVLVEANVGSVIKGRAGTPGQIQGSINVQKKIGTLYANSDFGIFGITDSADLTSGKALPLCLQKDIKVGNAVILSSISGRVEEYTIEISRVYSGEEERAMLITVTDEKLISQTGGIVQGMSGSPIIQNGKLVGAVTHVLVNEPEKGYGISIEKMLEKAYYVKQTIAA